MPDSGYLVIRYDSGEDGCEEEGFLPGLEMAVLVVGVGLLAWVVECVSKEPRYF